ncbi:Arginine-glutamic acid dipeptide repeats protein [Anabarilius grahami]|uniref:Arginine-glutamic acid dipeptide repeats protein n=1 Tax=Anabarilius grahami TaxID=495550 RepID=A0A3N0XEK0_ANAGA|nr:Arginine-glutamic acid dipeptide repeats protein [Anabarilius grahami]
MRPGCSSGVVDNGSVLFAKPPPFCSPQATKRENCVYIESRRPNTPYFICSIQDFKLVSAAVSQSVFAVFFLSCIRELLFLAASREPLSQRPSSAARSSEAAARSACELIISYALQLVTAGINMNEHQKALPLPGGTDKCAAVGMLEDETMLSIYNVLRVPDTHVRDCSMLSRRCTKLLKMKWADLMCRPAWKAGSEHRGGLYLCVCHTKAKAELMVLYKGQLIIGTAGAAGQADGGVFEEPRRWPTSQKPGNPR